MLAAMSHVNEWVGTSLAVSDQAIIFVGKHSITLS